MKNKNQKITKRFSLSSGYGRVSDHTQIVQMPNLVVKRVTFKRLFSLWVSFAVFRRKS